MYSNDDQGHAGLPKLYIFHYPEMGIAVLGCGHIGHIINMLNFFLNPMLYCWVFIDINYFDIHVFNLKYEWEYDFQYFGESLQNLKCGGNFFSSAWFRIL